MDMWTKLHEDYENGNMSLTSTYVDPKTGITRIIPNLPTEKTYHLLGMHDSQLPKH